MKIQLTGGYTAGQVIDVPEMTANILFDEKKAIKWPPKKVKTKKGFFK